MLPDDDTLQRIPLPPRISEDIDVLITSWSTAPFDPELLQGSRLRLAVHTAGTIRGLFPKQVLEHGLRLAQGGSDPMAKAVAELAITMTLVLLRDVHGMDRRLQSTRDWKLGGSGTLTSSIDARTVGLWGLSRTEPALLPDGCRARGHLVAGPRPLRHGVGGRGARCRADRPAAAVRAQRRAGGSRSGHRGDRRGDVRCRAAGPAGGMARSW